MFIFRCVWADRPSSCGKPAGKSSGGPDGVRAHTVPWTAPALWTAPTATASSEGGARQPHLSALLHAPCGENAHWDAHPWHAAVWQLHQLAVCFRTIIIIRCDHRTSLDVSVLFFKPHIHIWYWLYYQMQQGYTMGMVNSVVHCRWLDLCSVNCFMMPRSIFNFFKITREIPVMCQPKVRC